MVSTNVIFSHGLIFLTGSRRAWKWVIWCSEPSSEGATDINVLNHGQSTLLQPLRIIVFHTWIKLYRNHESQQLMKQIKDTNICVGRRILEMKDIYAMEKPFAEIGEEERGKL